jgi:O-antigen/teichoic acid export membrane protein
MPGKVRMRMNETPTPAPSAIPETGLTSAWVREEIGRGGRLAARVEWLAAWGAKGGLATMDQGLFAGAHFALNILLARWLAPAEYGAFAVAYSVFALAAAIHGALLCEPMVIFGSGRYFEKRRSYLGIVLRGHWAMTVPAGLTLFLVAFLLRGLFSPLVDRALWAVGLALPLMLLMWFTRRAFYIELRPGRAAAGSAVYFGSLLAVVWWLHAASVLTSAAAIAGMGLAALLAGGLQLAWLRPRHVHIPGGPVPRGVVGEHWAYGRWALGSAVAAWVSLNIYYLVLPAWFGLKEAGVMKALMNLANPMGHSLVALGMLVPPVLLRHRERGGLGLVRQTVGRVTGLFLTMAGIYFVVLWVFRVEVIHLLYDGKYLEYSNLPVLLMALAPLATACSVPVGSALRALERPDYVFWGYVAGTILAVSVGMRLAATWGVTGALAGYLASFGAQVGVFWFFYRRLGREVAAP